MKARFVVFACAAAVIAAWAPPGSAREPVGLPGNVGAEGSLNGVDTAGAGQLTVGNNQNINTNNDPGGAVTSNINDVASILFGGGSTITGFTGTNLIRFTSISAGAVGTTVNFNGNVFATTFNVTGTGTVNFNGNLNQGIVAANTIFNDDGFISVGSGGIFNSAIVTLTANTGTLTLNGGSSVIGAIGGANGLRQINVVGGNASVTGAVQARGFSLGANTLAITGALTTNSGGTISTTLASNTVFGRINPTGASNINAGGITVIPTVTGVLTTGTNFRIVNGLAGPLNVPVSVINNSPLFTFTGLATTTGDVNILLAAQTPAAALVTTPAATATASILNVIAPAGSDMLTVQSAIFALPSAAAIDSALAQLAPGAANLAAPWVAGQATRQFEDLSMARMDEIQDLCCDACDPNRKAASAHKCKDAENRGNWWGKGFGREGRQGDVDSVNGYKTRGYGVFLAYDAPLNRQTRAGLGFGYARNAIDGNNAGGSTDVDSYQATGYLSYAPGPWFVQGALNAGVDRYEGSRSIVFPGINRTAAASYSGHQYSGIVTAGMHLYNNQGVTVTPFGSLQYSRINVKSYTESGAGDVNLRVNRQNYDFVQSALGVKAERVMRSGTVTYAPEVHAKWLRDFNSTTMRQDVTFVGGATPFTAQGVKQDRDMFNLGGGITVLSCACEKDTWTVKGLYDYKWNQSNYSSHQLSMIASVKF